MQQRVWAIPPLTSLTLSSSTSSALLFQTSIEVQV